MWLAPAGYPTGVRFDSLGVRAGALHLVEGELAVELQFAVALRDVVAAVAVVLQLLHRLVPRLRTRAVEQAPRAPARDELQTRVRQTQPTAVLEGRVEVAYAPQLM